MFLDALADNLVEDDLEANRNATTLEVVIVIFLDFLYLGILLLGRSPFLHAGRFLHSY